MFSPATSPTGGRGRPFPHLFRRIAEVRGTVFAFDLSATSSAEQQMFGSFVKARFGQRLLCPDCAHVRFLAPGFYCARRMFPRRQQFSVNQSCYSMSYKFLRKEQLIHEKPLYQVARSTDLHPFR